jgi:hypothetical protein
MLFAGIVTPLIIVEAVVYTHQSDAESNVGLYAGNCPYDGVTGVTELLYVGSVVNRTVHVSFA